MKNTYLKAQLKINKMLTDEVEFLLLDSEIHCNKYFMQSTFLYISKLRIFENLLYAM